MIFKTLRSQLLFITIAPVIFIVVTAALFFLADRLRDADQDIMQRGAYLSEQLVLLSEFSFYTGNREELKDIGRLFMRSEDIDFIRFSDKHYNALAFIQKDEYQNSQVFNATVFNQGTNLDDFKDASLGNAGRTEEKEILGNITFGLSKNTVFSKKQEIYKRILIITTLAIIGGFILSYIFSRQLLSGLRSLQFLATKIESKQFDHRCQENASGELLKIQKMFNSMANSIQQNDKVLQGKIHFATKSLNESIRALSKKNDELDQTREQTIQLERSKAIADERNRIMKDMHDGIGGQLVASLALIEKEENSEIRESISDILSTCLDDFRLIINSLNTSANDLLSLLADFKYRMSKRLDSIKINLNWVVDDSIDNIILQPQQALHILRILQESFSNIIKHAEASNIDCQVRDSDSSVTITIDDNGNNFSSDDGHCGQGIKNIRWRADQLSGQASIGKNSHGGCRVSLTIPKHIFLKKNI